MFDVFYQKYQGSRLEFQMPEGSICKVKGTNVFSGNGICIQDECRQIGCDGVLDSDKKQNKCGMCDSGTENMFFLVILHLVNAVI